MLYGRVNCFLFLLQIFKDSLCPSYNETFSFWLCKKRTKQSLLFHLYHSGSVHTLIGESAKIMHSTESFDRHLYCSAGETEFQISDVWRPVTTWLTLSDSRHSQNHWGELMFSLSYLPTAERLMVVVVKARNLKLNTEQSNSTPNIFVKVSTYSLNFGHNNDERFHL